MDRLLNAIGDLFRCLPNIVIGQLRALANSAYVMIFAFYSLCFMQWILHGHAVVHILGLVLWLACVFHIFRPKNIFITTGIGEIAEGIGATPVVPGVFQNQFGNAILTIREKMFYFISIVALVIPMFPIRNNPWIIGIFTIVGTIVFVYILRTSGSLIRPLALSIGLVILTIHVFIFSFPQVQAHITWIKGPYNLFADEDIANMYLVASNANKERMKGQKKRDMNEVISWLEKNKSNGNPIPEDYDEFMKRSIQSGKSPTLAEVRKEINERKEEAKVKAIELVDTVLVSESNLPTQLNKKLPPDRYAIKAENGDKNLHLQILKKGKEESIGSYGSYGKYLLFTVPPGTEAYAIRSGSRTTVRIYNPEKS